MIILLIVVNYSSSTVQQEQQVQHPTHRPTCRRTDHVQQQPGKDVQQQYMSSVMQTLFCFCILGFTCFYGPPLCRGLGAAPFDAPRSPLAELALGPVLSPATPRAAVWGGRGTVTRPRTVAWCSGEPYQIGAFETESKTESDVQTQSETTFISVPGII